MGKSLQMPRALIYQEQTDTKAFRIGCSICGPLYEHLLKQKSSQALNVDFFSDKDGSDNINKGRPSWENMSSGFQRILPLLDAYVPKVG